ncbi:MAG: hypothetical protein KDC05_05995 [Bacteroidales bacterium]|nr:hypothetical protein [Bacteroidales bacterium]
MNEWWEALSSFEKIFWFIAIPFSIILIIQLIMTFIGMGDGDTDLNIDEPDISQLDLDGDGTINMDNIDIQTEGEGGFADTDPSFNLFTVRNFIAFFTLFGWGGIAAWNEGLSRPLTILVALLSGFIAMFLNASMFYLLNRLQDSGGGLKIQNALGQIGDVYIPVKANGGNVGRVQIAVQGSIREMMAITRENADLPTGTVIRVVGIVSNSILVVERNK